MCNQKRKNCAAPIIKSIQKCQKTGCANQALRDMPIITLCCAIPMHIKQVVIVSVKVLVAKAISPDQTNSLAFP
jgi:hypothetical protein